MSDEKRDSDPIREARDEVARPGVRPADLQAPGERAGDVIDRYKLLQEIGEGGMGTVWMAEQRDPVVRKVALKIVKLGMDTREVVTRFEAERQALALMDHPSIAKVLDGGATRSGRPYFVMELVKGVPITQYCDEAKLGLRDRLQLFAKVCEALQHAHQKGIIHRDVKPSNVMVTLQDGTPLPKVIDFGIAKATSAELTQKTLFTQYAQLIGTPEYMAPEQAALSALDIDTRADIYSLGVLLYELLTGTKPFDMSKALAKGYQELLRTIREDEPAKPSTRVSSLGAKGTRIAEQRHVNVEKLQHRLRGDLDWIVMKALEKDRTRRYETANGFALDVERYLRGEAVLAAPPSTSYRLRKFLGRRKKTVAAVAAIAFLLLLGSIGTGIGWYESHRANVALGVAIEEKEQQRQLAEAAKKTADEAAARARLAAASEAEAKVEAQASATQALAAAKRAETITQFVTTALQSGDAQHTGGGQEMTILAAMDNAIRDIRSGRFRDDPQIETSLKVTIGDILQNNGRLLEAEPLLAEACEALQQMHPGDHRDVAAGLCNLGLLRRFLGRPQDADADLSEAKEMLDRLYPGDEVLKTTVSNNLGLVRQDQGRLEEAESLYMEAVEMSRRLNPGDDDGTATFLINLASLQRESGRLQEAESNSLQSLEMMRRLHPGEHPDVAASLHNLGSIRREMGRPAAAEPILIQALEMWQRLYQGDHSHVAAALGSAGLAKSGTVHLAEAESLCLQSLAMYQRIYKGDHQDVAMSLTNLGGVRRRQGRLVEAEVLALQSLQMNQRLFPGDHLRVVHGLKSVAQLRSDMGRPEDALPLAESALEMAQRLRLGDHPLMESILGTLGGLQVSLGRLSEAEAAFSRALELSRRFYPDGSVETATAMNNLAMLLVRLGRLEDAEALQVESLEMFRGLFQGDHERVAFGLVALASILKDSGAARFAESEALLIQCIEMYQRLDPRGNSNLTHCKELLANIYWRQGKYDKSVPLYEVVLKESEAQRSREHPATQNLVACLGVNYMDAGRLSEAIPLLEEAYPLLKQNPNQGWVGDQLLNAYAKAFDPAMPDSAARIIKLISDLMATARVALPKESPALAGQLAALGTTLIKIEAWSDAESLLRECLTIREKTQPDAWTTFNTMSGLGAALLGQLELAEAEPLLLAGYQGLKEREASLPATAATRIPEALERLVKLYEALGNAAEAEAWRARLVEQGKSGK